MSAPGGMVAGPTVRLLGSLEVVGDAGPIDIGGAQPRVVLGLLAAAGGRAVSVDALIDAIWEDTPPASASGTLQTYVSRPATRPRPGRRGHRPRAGGLSARARSPGHRPAPLRGPGRRGPRGARCRRPVQARALLVEADGPVARRRPPRGAGAPELSGVARRFDERRVAALEDRLAADLALGRHAAVVGELAQLVTDHPLRERAVGAARPGPLPVGPAGRCPAGHRRGPRAPSSRSSVSSRAPSCATSSRPSSPRTPRSTSAPPAPAPLGPPTRCRRRRDRRSVAGRRPVLPGARRADRCRPSLARRAGGRARGPAPRPRPRRHRGDRASPWSRARPGSARPGWSRSWPTRRSGGVERVRGAAASRAVPLRPTGRGSAPSGRCGTPTPAGPTRPSMRCSTPRGPWSVGAAADTPSLLDGVLRLLEPGRMVPRLVLVLEDVQWADDESLELATHVASGLLSAGAVLIVLTLREGEDADRAAVTVLLRGCVPSDATPIACGSTGSAPRPPPTLLAQVVGSARSTPTVAQVVHDRAEGNPFFAIELQRLLDAEGLADVASVAARAVPVGVRDVVRQRLARLPQPTLELLQVAAVAGRDLDVELVSCGERPTHRRLPGRPRGRARPSPPGRGRPPRRSPLLPRPGARGGGRRAQPACAAPGSTSSSPTPSSIGDGARTRPRSSPSTSAPRWPSGSGGGPRLRSTTPPRSPSGGSPSGPPATSSSAPSSSAGPQAAISTTPQRARHPRQAGVGAPGPAGLRRRSRAPRARCRAGPPTGPRRRPAGDAVGRVGRSRHRR